MSDKIFPVTAHTLQRPLLLTTSFPQSGGARTAPVRIYAGCLAAMMRASTAIGLFWSRFLNRSVIM